MTDEDAPDAAGESEQSLFLQVRLYKMDDEFFSPPLSEGKTPLGKVGILCVVVPVCQRGWSSRPHLGCTEQVILCKRAGNPILCRKASWGLCGLWLQHPAQAGVRAPRDHPSPQLSLFNSFIC